MQENRRGQLVRPSLDFPMLKLFYDVDYFGGIAIMLYIMKKRKCHLR